MGWISYSESICYEIGFSHMAQNYYFTISLKGVPWKFWLDPRFPRNRKLKWIVKWLPLDRGYFKVYLLKKGKFLIIPCHTSLLTRNFVVFILNRVCITMHFILVKYLVFRYYWSKIPRKKRWHGNFGSILDFLVIPSKNEV